MARGGTRVDFNDSFFEDIGKSAQVTNMTRQKAEAVLKVAQADAPVDEGDYRDGLKVRMKASAFRNVAMVVGEDAKTLLVESKTGNLARALKKVDRG